MLLAGSPGRVLLACRAARVLLAGRVGRIRRSMVASIGGAKIDTPAKAVGRRRTGSGEAITQDATDGTVGAGVASGSTGATNPPAGAAGAEPAPRPMAATTGVVAPAAERVPAARPRHPLGAGPPGPAPVRSPGAGRPSPQRGPDPRGRRPRGWSAAASGARTRVRKRGARRFIGGGSWERAAVGCPLGTTVPRPGVGGRGGFRCRRRRRRDGS